MARPVDELTPEELRAEAAATLVAMRKIQELLSSSRERFLMIEGRLLNDQLARLREGEGVVTSGGVLVRREETKGRAWVNKEEVDKDGDELPAELQPVPDRRVVIEHLGDIPSGIAAELLALTTPGKLVHEDGSEETLEAPVKVTNKAKYPTVAALRRAYGETTKYVGVPPVETSIVLRIGEGDEAVELSRDGLA